MITVQGCHSRMTHREFSRKCGHTQAPAFRSGNVCTLVNSSSVKAEICDTGSNAWSSLRSTYDYHPDEDRLPPFSMLKSDEDRERKAEHKIPGTYHIVANPASFAGLEEYRDSQDSSRCNSVSRPSRSPKGRSSSANKPSSSNVDVYEDPETLILGTFEDNVRKMPTLGLLTTHLSKSPTSSLTSHSPATSLFQTARLSSRSDENPPMFDSTVQSKADQEIVAFYRNFVRRQLNQVHRDSLGTPSQSENMTFSEVLDKNADSFPPVCSAAFVYWVPGTITFAYHELCNVLYS